MVDNQGDRGMSRGRLKGDPRMKAIHSSTVLPIQFRVGDDDSPFKVFVTLRMELGNEVQIRADCPTREDADQISEVLSALPAMLDLLDDALEGVFHKTGTRERIQRILRASLVRMFFVGDQVVDELGHAARIESLYNSLSSGKNRPEMARVTYADGTPPHTTETARLRKTSFAHGGPVSAVDRLVDDPRDAGDDATDHEEAWRKRRAKRIADAYQEASDRKGDDHC